MDTRARKEVREAKSWTRMEGSGRWIEMEGWMTGRKDDYMVLSLKETRIG